MRAGDRELLEKYVRMSAPTLLTAPQEYALGSRLRDARELFVGSFAHDTALMNLLTRSLRDFIGSRKGRGYNPTLVRNLLATAEPCAKQPAADRRFTCYVRKNPGALNYLMAVCTDPQAELNGTRAPLDTYADLRQEFVRHNVRLVVSIAYKRFPRERARFDDIVAFGFDGLWYAVDHYAPKKNRRFSTYATPCIWGRIMHGLGRSRESEKRSAEARTLSLDELVGGITRADTVPSPDRTAAVHTEAYVEGLLRRLGESNPRGTMAAEIIRARFGIGRQRQTLTEVGAQWNLTRERVCQLERQFLQELRVHTERVHS
jgi:RNA polymerase sigma factor (sigma-70 family)